MAHCAMQPYTISIITQFTFKQSLIVIWHMSLELLNNLELFTQGVPKKAHMFV